MVMLFVVSTSSRMVVDAIRLLDSVLVRCSSLPLVRPSDVMHNGHAADLSVRSLLLSKT